VSPRSILSHSAAGDNPGQQILRKNPLCAFVVSIHGKRDALVKERLVSLVFAASQFARTQAQKQVIKLNDIVSADDPQRGTSRGKRRRVRTGGGFLHRRDPKHPFL
jgi:hypothetical protein